MRRRWQDRIAIDPEIHHGDPCIKGTRIPVAMVVGSLADGMLLRPDQGGIRPTVELIERVLPSYDRNAQAGTTTVVTPRGMRVRKSV